MTPSAGAVGQHCRAEHAVADPVAQQLRLRGRLLYFAAALPSAKRDGWAQGKIVEIFPAGSTRRTRPFSVSAMYIAPESSTATA